MTLNGLMSDTLDVRMLWHSELTMRDCEWTWTVVFGHCRNIFLAKMAHLVSHRKIGPCI